jgi:phosphatidylserine/phosphatidylglycerophosphate/cardiolipin synthase-like enzyme
MQLLVSPWTRTFDTLVRSIERSALIVSPYITADPLQYFAKHLKSPGRIQIEILTNLAVDSMIQGSTSPRALVEFSVAVPSTNVRHLPGLHAKVYVADKRVAVITSANLTRGGLRGNYEYGIEIADSATVHEIVTDLEGYGALGAEVSVPELQHLAEAVDDLQGQQSRVMASAKMGLREEFEARVTATQESLLSLRATSAQSTNAIFSRTILYLLGRGPLSTQQLNPLVQRIHPDLCDDSVDRVIQGVHFGRRWKHMVRNAQQSLAKQGRVNLQDGRWHLGTG